MQDAHGAYAKKWLILNVAEADGRKREPIGRVVIDLAEFASMGDGQVGCGELSLLHVVAGQSWCICRCALGSVQRCLMHTSGNQDP